MRKIVLSHSLNIKILFISLLFLVVGNHSLLAEPTSFDMNLTQVSQTCVGNGKINVNITNANLNSVFEIAFYQLPNTTTPIRVVNNIVATSPNFIHTENLLTAGNYMVVATQTIATQTFQLSQNITIQNSFHNLAYNLVVTPLCVGNSIKVNVTAGNSVTYELRNANGTVLVPAQTSNTFAPVFTGTYLVVVNDACGNAVSQSISVVNPVYNYSFQRGTTGNYSFTTFSSCTTLTHTERILINGNANLPACVFPINVTYTISNPTGGANTVINSTWTSNANNNEQVNIPYYPNATYSYNVTITDACGNTITHTDTLSNIKYNFNFLRNNEYGFTKLSDCNTIAHIEKIQYNFTDNIPNFLFPIQVNITIQNPTGGPNTVISTVWNSIADNSLPVNIPFYENYQYQYTVTLIDACGKTTIKTDTISAILDFSFNKYMTTCATDGFNLLGFKYIIAPFTVTFLTYPNGFAPSNFNNAFQPNSFSATFNSIPQTIPFGVGANFSGNYSVKIVDACGRIVIRNYNYAPDLGTAIIDGHSTNPDCTGNSGAISMGVTCNTFSNIQITQAPNNYNYPLPHDVSSYIDSNQTSFSIENLPVGTYNFLVNCNGQIFNKTYTIVPNELSSLYTTDIFCSHFNLNFNISTNLYKSHIFLQKYYPESNQWGHPETSALYDGVSNIDSSNSLSVLNLNNSYSVTQSITLNNLPFTGTFRLVLNSNNTCFIPLHTFEVPPSNIILHNFYVTNCLNGATELIIDAEGHNPLQYEIVEFNGAPFSINNANNPVFQNLPDGEYVVNITDACSNVFVFQFKTSQPVGPVIQPHNLCTGLDGYLFVDIPDFMEIIWTKDNDSTPLGTDEVLAFNPFDANVHSGLYHAYVYDAENPTSCITQTIDYQVTEMVVVPEAGTGLQYSVIQPYAQVINLFDYISGTYDDYGQWYDVQNDVFLPNNMLNTTTLAVGTYYYKYIVDSGCSGVDETTVTVEILPTELVAVNDNFVEICINASSPLIYNVMNNDTYQGNLVDQSLYSTVVVEPDVENVISIDIDGFVTIIGVPVAGHTYHLRYKIFEDAFTNNYAMAYLYVTFDDNPPIIEGSLSSQNLIGCNASVLPAPYSTVQQIVEAGVSITDNDTSVANMTLSYQDTLIPDSCITYQRRYTIIDSCGNSSFINQFFYLAKPDFTLPPDTASDVNCISNIIPPTLPTSVLDACGTVLTPSIPNITPNVNCTNTVVYAYTYTDCSNNSHVWKHTFNVLNPGGITAPTSASSTIYNVSDATQPAAPAAIQDACGNQVLPVLVGMTPIDVVIGCSTDYVWKYRYTACNNSTAEWTYTYHYLGYPTTPTGTAIQEFCANEGATVGDLSVNITPNSNNLLHFYSSMDNFNNHIELPLSTLLSDDMVVFVSQTNANGCESLIPLQITVNFIASPAPPTLPSPQYFCEVNHPTLSNLNVNNNSTIQWYAESSGGSPLVASNLLTNTVYYASQNNNFGCQSDERTPVTVILQPDSPAPTGNNNQTFCTSDYPTIADLVVNPTSNDFQIVWTDAVGNLLNTSTALVHNTIYYAHQQQVASPNCLGTQSLAVQVTLEYVTLPNENYSFEFCQGNQTTIQELNLLIPNSANFTWYDSSTGGNTLPNSTVLSEQMYYAEITNANLCHSLTRLPVNVTFDVDCDNDGIPDDEELSTDTDHDGLPNYNDPDDDGDGINTIDEDSNHDGNYNNDDCNLNGIPNYLDPNPCDLIPNAFSPNGDDINDLFVIPYVSQFPNYTIEIYNRWGTMVYKYANKGASPISGWWDGVANTGLVVYKDGEVLPAGTYYFIIDPNQDNETPKHGWLYLNK